jgi:hypothetical protein
MAHNWSCAEATSPGCTCACGGARHGCQGAFRIAGGTAEGVRAYVVRRDREDSAIGSVQADVVDWLHRDRELLECAWTAQEWVFENRPDAPTQGLLLRKVEERLGAGGMGEFQEWARETHFWCELLAQMVFAIAQYEKYRGRIFGMVEDALSQREVSALPDELRSGGRSGSRSNGPGGMCSRVSSRHRGWGAWRRCCPPGTWNRCFGPSASSPC